MELSLEELVEKAKQGSKEALEELVRQIMNNIYGLALRMLYNPSDAEDAAQEILVKIIANLGTFMGKSAFKTWMFKVAYNHILTIRKRKAEHNAVSFKEYEESLDTTTSYEWEESSSDPMQNIIIEEIRISCLQGLLLCLERDYRIVFILSEVFNVTGIQGGEILGVTPEAFRKRLSRARERMSDFLLRNCSLVNPESPCQCERYAALDIKKDRAKEDLIFVNRSCKAKSDSTVLNHLKELNALNKINILFNSYPEVKVSDAFIIYLKKLIQSDRFELVS